MVLVKTGGIPNCAEIHEHEAHLCASVDLMKSGSVGFRKLKFCEEVNVRASTVVQIFKQEDSRLSLYSIRLFTPRGDF